MKTSKIVLLVFLVSLFSISCSEDSSIQIEDNLEMENQYLKYTIGDGPFVYFEDLVFKEFLLNNFELNANKDNEISFEEATAFNGAIDISFKEIKSLTGIEKFVNMIALNCANNKLNTLDLSMNLNLEILDCGNNPFNEIDLSLNTKLSHLEITNTNISTLDLSNNTNLIVIKAVCSYNLKTVDIRNKNNTKILVFFLDLKNNALECVEVDNLVYATNSTNWFIPETARYSLNCFDSTL